MTNWIPISERMPTRGDADVRRIVREELARTPPQWQREAE